MSCCATRAIRRTFHKNLEGYSPLLKFITAAWLKRIKRILHKLIRTLGFGWCWQRLCFLCFRFLIWESLSERPEVKILVSFAYFQCPGLAGWGRDWRLDAVWCHAKKQTNSSNVFEYALMAFGLDQPGTRPASRIWLYWGKDASTSCKPCKTHCPQKLEFALSFSCVSTVRMGVFSYWGLCGATNVLNMFQYFWTVDAKNS